MNCTIDRDSDAMRSFAKAIDYFCEEVMFYCDDLQRNINAAEPKMQNDNTLGALKALTEMLESIRVKVYAAEQLSYRIIKSAQKVEESDTII